MKLKHRAPDFTRGRRPGIVLAALLACWLVVAQTATAAHDIIHFAHEHGSLCEQLGHGGHTPALTAQAAQLDLAFASCAVLPPPAVSRFSTVHYPGFHSRAPPR